MHLDDERIERLLHGELTPEAAAAVRQHVAICDECRSSVAASRREEDEVYALLRHIDHPVPRVEIRALTRRPSVRDLNAYRWVAGVVLALGLGGLAYAIPGSPLPAVVNAIVEWVSRRPNPSVPDVERTAPPLPETGIGGIAVVPGTVLVVSFTTPHAHTQIEVSLTDGDRVEVQGPSGAATFHSEVDRLTVDNPSSSASFTIQVPRNAPRIEIRVAGKRIFLKDGMHIEAPASTLVSGAYRLPLAPPSP